MSSLRYRNVILVLLRKTVPHKSNYGTNTRGSYSDVLPLNHRLKKQTHVSFVDFQREDNSRDRAAYKLS